MFRFFVDSKNDQYFNLSEEALKHMKVARIKTGDFFIAIYEGKFYKCKLENREGAIIEAMQDNHEYSGEVIIAASIINIKKMEWLIQKASELGATKLIPMISQNVSVKITDSINKKIDRWNQIAKNASEQSFRNAQMIVDEIKTFDDVIKMNIENKFIAHEKFEAKITSEFPVNSLFAIGPEGGFTDKEVEDASKHGFSPISLGPRILRAETASLFVLSRVKI